MADISTEIEAFRSAERGEQVRSSMISAIEKINEEVENAVENQLIAVDETLTESGQGADAKKVGDELTSLKSALPFSDVSGESEMADTSAMYRMDGYIYYYNNVTNNWKKVGSGEATDGMLKPVTLHTIEAEADEVLTNTRVLSNSASTVNGYNTYLISFEQITQPVINRYGTVATNGWQYWGFYKGTGSSRTYLSVNTFTTYIIQPRNDYDGVFFCNNTGNYSMEFITGIDVITNDGYPSDRIGFTSVSSDYCPFVAHSGDAYLAVKIPKTDNRVYRIDIGNMNYANSFYKTASGTATAIGTAQVATIGGNKKLTFANLSNADTLIVVRANGQDGLRTLCERGMYMYALTDVGAVVASRKKLPLQMISHACNTMDALLMSLANGWGGAEFDVRTSSDGKYVLSHETAIGGKTISSETYESLAQTYPNILTFDEMVKYSAPFDFWLDMHFGGVSTEAEKLQLLRNGLACTDKVGYWTGAVNVQYYKKGLCYGFGYGTTSAPDSTDDDRAFNYYIGERSDLDIEKPFRYFAKDLGSGSSVSLSNIKSGTYAGYSFVTAYYSVNSSQIYLE